MPQIPSPLVAFHAENVGWMLTLLRFHQGVEIHFSPGVQIRGDTDTESRYVEENCCLDTTAAFFPCVFVKFFFRSFPKS